MRSISFSFASSLAAFFLFACGSRTLDDNSSDASLDVADGSDSSTDVADGSDASDFTRCSGPGTCTLVSKSCCGTCGAATAADMIGVESSHANDYRLAVCSGTGCPACFMQQDAFLASFCEGGACSATDLHTSAMTTCATDADCQLRYAPCCEPCGAPTTGLIALRKDQVATYRTKMCAADAACPKCVVGYPSGARAACDATKHCSVTGLPM